jgi:hypothetical protein
MKDDTVVSGPENFPEILHSFQKITVFRTATAFVIVLEPRISVL